MSEELTYGQKLIAEAIQHHFGDRPGSDDEYEDADDTTLRDVWDAFDTAWNRRAPSPDMHEVVSLLETASVALWRAGSNSTAREIDRYLDRVSPDSTAKIDASSPRPSHETHR